MDNQSLSQKLLNIYRRLMDCYGPQHWWPAKEPFEVMVGAILTQSAAWINAEKAIIVGNRNEIKKRYGVKRERGGTKRKGPFFPRMPDRILKRTVRGMLPYQVSRGREAYKNFKAYIGVPNQFQKEKPEKLNYETMSTYITLSELSQHLGV